MIWWTKIITIVFCRCLKVVEGKLVLSSNGFLLYSCFTSMDSNIGKDIELVRSFALCTFLDIAFYFSIGEQYVSVRWEQLLLVCQGGTNGGIRGST